VPWIDAEDLPTTLGAFDVCIGIAGTTAKAKRVVPNKIFQGAAAGCAIVTSDTPPQRRVLGDAAMYFPPGDAAALASVLHLLAADPSLLQALGTRARSRARESFTPHAIAQPLVDALVPAGDEARR
jgi:glycosyltransferase involved in cell wall biosynthesis